MSKPSFRRRKQPPAVRARLVSMGVVLCLVAAMLVARAWRERPEAVAELPVVEVRGDVPDPGFHELVGEPTVHAALRAAGVQQLDGIVDAALGEGTRVVLEGGRVQLEPMDELLVFDLPVDVNVASEAALLAIPGIGPSRAAAILAEREANGAFEDVDALSRVKGIGPATVEELRPFLVAGGAEAPTPE